MLMIQKVNEVAKMIDTMYMFILYLEYISRVDFLPYQ